jgi:hypothetical protein
MAWGPSPGIASGHQGEARKTRSAGPRRPRLKARKGGSSEDHLGISMADFCFICSPKSVGIGIISWGRVHGTDWSVAGRDPATAGRVTLSLPGLAGATRISK